MKTTLFTISLIVCLLQFGFSQEEDGVVALDLPVRNSLVFNRYALNPTFSFVRQQDRFFSISNKREWVQFDNAPETYLASYSGRLTERIGGGIAAFQQDYGVLSTIGGLVNFAYNVQINQTSNLTFGLNVGAYTSGINTSNVITNFEDPSLQNVASNFLLTVNPGINYGTEFLDFGLSVNNLVLYNFESSSIMEDNPKRGIQAHVMHTGYFNSRGFFEDTKFSALLRSEFRPDETIISGLALLHVPKGIWLQLGYNSVFGVSGGLGINITKQIALEYNIEKSIGELIEFGSSHEITLAYRFGSRKSFKYSGDDEVSGLFTKKRKRAVKVSDAELEGIRSRAAERRAEAKLEKDGKTAKAIAAKEEANKKKELAAIEADKAKKAEEKLQEEQKTEIDPEELARIEAEKAAKQRAEARAKLLQEERAQRAAEEKAERQAELEAKRLAKEKAEAEAQAKLVAEQQAKKKAEAQAKLAAEQKARKAAEAQALLIAAQQAEEEAEKQAQLIAEQKAKEEAEAQAKLEAEQKAKEAAEAQALLIAAQQAKEEAEKQAQLIAEQKAKEEAEAEATRIAEQQAKEQAEKQAQLIAEQRAKEEAEAQALLIAEQKAKEEAAAAATVNQTAESETVPEANDDLGKSMEVIAKRTENSKADQAKLLEDLDAIIQIKDEDLKAMKRENDLSDQGVAVQPRAFKSITAENNKLNAIKENLDDIIESRNKEIEDLKELYEERFQNTELDDVNLFYKKKIKRLTEEQLKAVQTRAQLDAKLETIRIATEVEKRRRIKRAAFDSEDDRYAQDRAMLKNIKRTTQLVDTPYQTEDFDFGEKQGSNIQILKNVQNVESGYYLIIAVHNDVNKRNEFVKKVVASGRTNVDFFYDVKSSNYYIYYDKFDDITGANSAMESKGNRPYNANMSLVKIEN